MDNFRRCVVQAWNEAFACLIKLKTSTPHSLPNPRRPAIVADVVVYLSVCCCCPFHVASTLAFLWLLLLLPLPPSGFSVLLRAVSRPNDSFDGTTTVDFEAYGMGTSLSGVTDGDDEMDGEETTVSYNVTFYHCLAGTFWSPDPSEGTANTSLDDCLLCTSSTDGDTEVTEEYSVFVLVPSWI